jgi:molecular chaperone GrpE
MADLANIRKRQAREFDEARKRAIEGIAAELLPVLDNFHLALAAHEQRDAANSEVKNMLEGLVMVRSLLEGTLERHGLSEIPAQGATFDPNLHEAVGVDAESDAAPGTITKVAQRGYLLGEKVLRASRVLVAGQPPQDGGTETAPADGGPRGDA